MLSNARLKLTTIAQKNSLFVDNVWQSYNPIKTQRIIRHCIFYNINNVSGSINIPQSTDQIIKYNFIYNVYIFLSKETYCYYFSYFLILIFTQSLCFLLGIATGRQFLSVVVTFVRIPLCSNFGNSIQFKACPSSCQLFLIQHCFYI